jgi:hypothetical protein
MCQRGEGTRFPGEISRETGDRAAVGPEVTLSTGEANLRQATPIDHAPAQASRVARRDGTS